MSDSTLSRSSVSLSLALFVTAGAAVAAPQDRGMASSWPAGVILKSDGGQALKLRPVVDDGGPRLLEDFAPGGPGVDYSQVFDVPGFTNVEVDAISTGNGFIPGLDGTGTPTMGNRFLVAAMSLDDATAPGPNVFHHGTSATLPGSAIGSYYFHLSKYIPFELVGKSRLEFNGDDVRLQASSNPDIVGLDFGMGIHDLGVDTSGSQFFRQGEWMYFSVTPEFAQNNQQPFASPSPGLPASLNPLPGDIYVRRWDPQNGWDGPYLFATAQDLGFAVVDPGTEPEDHPDVDALDYDSFHNIIIYSMTETTRSMLHSSVTGSQVMVADFAEGTSPGYNLGIREVSPTPLKSRAGGQTKKVTVRIRIDDLGGPDSEEEVDALCTWDPEGGDATPNALTPVREGTQSPGGPPVALANQMSISMTRVPLPGGSTTYDRGVLQISGWGPIQPRTSLIKVFRKHGKVNEVVTDPNDDWTQIAIIQRHANRHDSVYNYDTLPANWSSNNTVFTSFRAELWTRDRNNAWIMVATSWAGEIASL